MKDIKYLELGEGLYIENNELKERIEETIDDVGFETWDECWGYVMETLRKIKDYDDNSVL